MKKEKKKKNTAPKVTYRSLLFSLTNGVRLKENKDFQFESEAAEEQAVVKESGGKS